MRVLVTFLVVLAAVATALGVLVASAPLGSPGSVLADRLYFEAPAGERFTRIDRDGETVLPNGRLLTPTGRQIPTAPHPFGLALSPDGTVLVTVNGGVVPFSLTVIRNPQRRDAAGRPDPREHRNRQAAPPLGLPGRGDRHRPRPGLRLGGRQRRRRGLLAGHGRPNRRDRPRARLSTPTPSRPTLP